MNRLSILIAGILLALASLIGNSASAVSHPYDFHTDAKMVHKSYGPVDKAYGYMNVITNDRGNGVINVMFSNGSSLNLARFNARVVFLSASGSVIKEEHFGHRISAAGYSGAVERKVSKPLTVSNFDSIRVDFYLSDIPE